MYALLETKFQSFVTLKRFCHLLKVTFTFFEESIGSCIVNIFTFPLSYTVHTLYVIRFSGTHNFTLLYIEATLSLSC